MIPLSDAQRLVWGAMRRLDVVSIDHREAVGLVRAEDVVADEDVPPFDNSAVDGYAVRAEDVTTNETELQVVDTVAAGRASAKTIGAGEAMRIMTGAPIPGGASAVVMVEDSEKLGDDRVRRTAAARPGAAIREAGSDVKRGERVFRAGSVLNAASIGVLASINARHVQVYRRARVALLSTGDELVTDGSVLAPGQIRESNLTMLDAIIRATGCEVVNLGIVSDDESELERVFVETADDVDAFVTSGGVSMGDYDVVKAVLSKIAEMHWMQMAIKPAKPFAFGMLRAKDGRGVPVFGLPGNPVSSMISYELLARPALRTMMGNTEPERAKVRAITDVPLKRKRDGKEHFMRVVGHFGDDGRLHVRDSGPQGSHQLAATALANGVARVPDGDGLPAGADVEVFLLD
ncbi:MAG: gephyrin-like molybdotransferase Glp [Actinomycetota bacterium]